MKCPRCSFENQAWLKICSRCKTDMTDLKSRSNLYDLAFQYEGYCGSCGLRRQLNTWHQSSADDGWDCPDEFCGRILKGRTGEIITPDNLFEEAWKIDK